MPLDALSTYLNSPEFTLFISGQARLAVLVAMLVAFIALLLELRLPVRAYWQLPSHTFNRLLISFGLKQAPPQWGTCTDQTSRKPLPLVAVELLDLSNQKVLRTTYSDRQGHYGFPLQPGRYLIRATKSHYRQPSFLNPENIEVKSLQHAFVAEVTVVNHQVAPLVDLALSQSDSTSTSTAASQLGRYGRMLFFQLGHILVIVSAVVSLIALWNRWDSFYAIILGLCLILLFIKLYLLQMIGLLAAPNPATDKNHA